jgi:hypothetical protein
MHRDSTPASPPHRLDHNRIRALPNFEALSSLRNFRMQHNEITAFVPSMTALVQLKEMDLSQARPNAAHLRQAPRRCSHNFG